MSTLWMSLVLVWSPAYGIKQLRTSKAYLLHVRMRSPHHIVYIGLSVSGTSVLDLLPSSIDDTAFR
jgi:hypothetical protein